MTRPAGQAHPLALTMGDPAGIGPEITLQAWTERHARHLPVFAVYADPALLHKRAADLGLAIDIATIATPADAAAVFERALPVLPVALPKPAHAGQPDTGNARAVIESIERAVADVAAGRAAAVVTNPIAKSVLYGAGFKHPGHTEFLASLAKDYWPGVPSHAVMMLACDLLRVVPLTIHVPLSHVPQLITPTLILDTVRTVDAALRADFGIARPRIAVAGLNPHAGEAGTLGREDVDIIRPALDLLLREGFTVFGPLAGDTLFHDRARETYDAAIAMYHDQALIPIKTLAFDDGVNVTLGLPFLRTSPDHGTAFDIAGKGIASATSLMAALRMAADMAARRAMSARAGAALASAAGRAP